MNLWTGEETLTQQLAGKRLVLRFKVKHAGQRAADCTGSESEGQRSLPGFLLYTCSGSLSCSRPLCLRVVCRIFTSSAGLQDDSRGISSRSLSTKLSWRWGSSVRNSLQVPRNMGRRKKEWRAFRDLVTNSPPKLHLAKNF